jgi:hypothetical protein
LILVNSVDKADCHTSVISDHFQETSMKSHRKASRSWLAVIGAAVLLPAGISLTATAAENDQTFPVPVSINALMVTLIDHSAHYLWDYGVMQREITDEEWRTVEYYAIQLAASGPLLTLGGAGLLDDTWAKSPMWKAYAQNMSDAAVRALEASRNKDKQALLVLGNALTDSCESCHEAFKPALPTEGIGHEPDYDFLYHLFKTP